MKIHFPLLDPLRFGAALGVAIFHLMFWSWAWPSIGAAPGFERYVAAEVLFPSAARFTWFGWVGVEIFFVISGFVIANSAGNASQDNASGDKASGDKASGDAASGETASATGFLVSRALRLYPAVWVCATATLLVLLLFAGETASDFILPYVSAMLLIPKGLGGQWIDSVYWTLAAEMAFYGLVFCVLLTKKITLRHLAWGLTIYSGAFNAFALLVVSQVNPSDTLYLVVLMFRVPCAAWLLCHGCFFALGIWLFISAHRKWTVLERFAVAVTCLSGMAEIYCFSSFLRTNIPAIADQSPAVPIAVWAAAVSIIALVASRNRARAGIASLHATDRPRMPGYPRALSCFRTLGLITYPLYLTHNVIGAAMVRVLVEAGLDASLSVAASLGMLILLCWFICARIEPAIRRRLADLFAHAGLLPKTAQPSGLPTPPAGLGLPLPIRAKANAVGRPRQ